MTAQENSQDPHPSITGAPQSDPQSARPTVLSERPTVLIVKRSQLRPYIERWEKLASVALECNPFYEPWTLLPAIEHLAAESNLHFFLVFAPASSAAESELLGFFPIEVTRSCLHLPIRTLTFWQHRYCFLNVPLIHRDYAWPVLELFWQWFESNPFGCHVLDTNRLPSEGRFHKIWSDFALGRQSLILSDYPRAAFYSKGTGEECIASVFSKKHLREFRRQRRQLSELGKCEFHSITKPEDVDDWIDQFLEVESSGWKGGPNGGAFARFPSDVRYLRDITHAGFRRGSVMLLSLKLDGKPIAVKHNLISGNAGFTFKIAFSEPFAKYSPGTLLELENIRIFVDELKLDRMDSCAAPRHPLMNRVFGEVLMVRQTLFSSSSRRGNFIIASLPLLRWIYNQFRSHQRSSNFHISPKPTSQGGSTHA